MEEKFEKIKKIVEKELSCSAHDMEHIMRVYNLALHIAKNENVDLNIIKTAALLHDIARVKEDDDQTGKIDHAILGAKMAKLILENLKFSEEKIKHILECIVSHRYRTGNKPKTKEAQILFEADKLDTLGAIGIARAFVWVGGNNANIYRKVNTQKYVKDNLGGKINGRIKDKTKHSPQIEWETKTKFLGNKIKTIKGKEILKERMDFYKNFLNRLEKEIKGKI